MSQPASRIAYLKELASLAICLTCLAVNPAIAAAADPASAPAPVPAAPVVQAPDAASVVEGGAGEIPEPDLAEQQLSNAARVRLDRARDSIVQIRGFFGDAGTSAFHGSGFAANADGMIITNYHVVAAAVLHPRQYRLEYVTSENLTGRLHVYAIDVRNDLAVVKADELKLPPLRLRTQIPRQGDRAYSIGFPLDLGLTITEGVANGLVANGLDQRIHYTGAINSGMSGGPALDAAGAVYGVNASVITGRQLVGFVVPASHIEPLLARARSPMDKTLSARQAREMVTAQVLAYQSALFEPAVQGAAIQTVFGFTLPTQIGPAIECGATGAGESDQRLRTETIFCAARARVTVQSGLEVGDIRFQHSIVRTQGLHPLQFDQRVNSLADNYPRSGSSRDVADFACAESLVSLDGFDARVRTCTRQYRLFSGLYDIAATVTSINSTQSAVVSQLDLRGVGFEPGMQFVRRYLEAMRWTP
ncbi:MAG: serine protease [Pseudomonadota bacterium]